MHDRARRQQKSCYIFFWLYGAPTVKWTCSRPPAAGRGSLPPLWRHGALRIHPIFVRAEWRHAAQLTADPPSLPSLSAAAVRALHDGWITAPQGCHPDFVPGQRCHEQHGVRPDARAVLHALSRWDGRRRPLLRPDRPRGNPCGAQGEQDVPARLVGHGSADGCTAASGKVAHRVPERGARRTCGSQGDR